MTRTADPHETIFALDPANVALVARREPALAVSDVRTIQRRLGVAWSAYIGGIIAEDAGNGGMVDLRARRDRETCEPMSVAAQETLDALVRLGARFGVTIEPMLVAGTYVRDHSELTHALVAALVDGATS